MQITSQQPLVFVIFGMTGDLSTRKIIPSLWYLFKHKYLSQRTVILGFSRKELTSHDIEILVTDSLSEHAQVNQTSTDLKAFCKLFRYISGTFDNHDAYAQLQRQIGDIEKAWNTKVNRIFFFAVPPIHYEPILQNLSQHKLDHQSSQYWCRILIEKPFGSDLNSARKLQALIGTYFTEDQIYRIDHYLFKEIIQGIENFRFSNNLFEHLWNNHTIERIDLRLHETLGVEDRAGFYDSVGALRDVGQNHLLSMLAMITMHYPKDQGSIDIQKERAKILRALSPWNSKLLKQNTFRAQYRGYAEIPHIQENSNTETFFHIKTELKHPRWSNIPIYISGGKKMAEVNKEIIITLAHPQICHLCKIGEHEPNRIIFKIAPHDEITICFWAKKPGLETIIEERNMTFFLYEKEMRTQYVEEYAKVIHAAATGDQSYFTSAEEVEAMWQFTDPIIDFWSSGNAALQLYDENTNPL